MKPMKQMILAAAILCCTMPAMAGDAYVGASLGRSQQTAHMGGFLIHHTGYATAYKLFGGYQFTPNFGVETGFADLGKLAVEGGPEWAHTRGNVRPRMLYAAATASMPLTDRFTLSGKLGVAATRLTHTINTGGGDYTESHNGGNLVAGIGASYALNEKVALVAEYENFGKIHKVVGEDVKAEMVSVGVRMKF
jgi:OOP family OmpA-OmpF porin